MSQDEANDRSYLISSVTASASQRRLAGAVVALSLLGFLAIAPFAKTQLAGSEAFVAAYQSSLLILDLTTVALLISQFSSFNSRALLALAGGYLFTASMTVAHTLTFPGLFSPAGLLDADPQSTAWLYMFWHGGFPLFVIAYALIKRWDSRPLQPATHLLIPVSVAAAVVMAIVLGLTLLATRGVSILPAIMAENHYTPSMAAVVSSVWLLSLIALVTLWVHKPHSVLDLWLMVTMCAWLIDIALSAVLNQGRFDLGFYSGRIFGLFAASFILLVLLTESGMLYKKLVQLTTMLKRLTTQDALTGIANRRAFDQALDLEWHLAMRSGLPLSLMMVDVDHFKLFNDSHGHIEGDKCLRAVAAALQSTMTRATDLVARYGGEEFAVLLPQTAVKAAGELGEELRIAVSVLAIPNQLSEAGLVTVSIGVACIQSSPPTDTNVAHAQAGHADSTKLVEMADRLLYEAKAAGRNRVMVGTCAPQTAGDTLTPPAAPAHG